MRKTHFSRSRIFRALVMVAILLTVAPLSGAIAQTPYDFGVICENGTAPAVELTAKDGYISIPDGNTVYMWGFAFGNGDYQHPGPTLCFTEGASVSITLHNTLPESVSIIFPGQTGVTTSGGNGVPANSLAVVADPNGSVTYNFTASRAGTFLYESGTSLQKQVQMGLFGAIIVRPANCSTCVYDSTKTQFNSSVGGNNDYLMLLSEIDPDWHAAVEEAVNEFAAGGTYNPQPFSVVDYHPRYWQINGRSFPDTIAPNHASWLPTQPYGALLHILPSAQSVIHGADGFNVASGDPNTAHLADPNYYQQYPSAVRMLNVGMRNHPIHPHGNHVQIIGRDGHALLTDAIDQSYPKFDVMVGAGQAWDVLYDWTNKDYYNPDTNPVPFGVETVQGDTTDRLLDPHALNLLFKDPNFFSGSPYLGYQANKNDGAAASYNECGEYYQIWHSHALDEAANYEAGFGGMITLERIDPPGHFNCQ